MPAQFLGRPKSIEKAYFKKPDPKNGLEILFRAFDLAEGDPTVANLAAFKSGARGANINTVGLEKVLRLEEQSLSLPYNLSPILFHPSPGLPVQSQLMAAAGASDFLIWTDAKMIAKATAKASDYWFQSGKSGEATRALLLQLKVSHRTLPVSTISVLVSVATDAIAYAGFQRNLFNLKPADIELILKSDFLAPVSLYQKAADVEKLRIATTAKLSFASLKDPQSQTADDGVDVQAILARYRK